MDNDTGYELNDPKHPTYYERYADYADYSRKRDKENGPEEREGNDGRLDESTE